MFKELLNTVRSEVLIDKFKVLSEDLKTYLTNYEFLFKTMGFSIAISGLFLNLDSANVNLRRLEAFFLILTCLLISWFIIKSLYSLIKGKHSESYYALVAFPIWIGASLIYNFWKYLIDNFHIELYYYVQTIGIPLAALSAVLVTLALVKFFSRYKNFDFSQIYLWTISIAMGITLIYLKNGYSILEATKTFFDEPLSLWFIYIIILAVFFEHFSPKKPMGRIEKILALTSIFFLCFLPLLIHFSIQRLIEIQSLTKDPMNF